MPDPRRAEGEIASTKPLELGGTLRRGPPDALPRRLHRRGDRGPRRGRGARQPRPRPGRSPAGRDRAGRRQLADHPLGDHVLQHAARRERRVAPGLGQDDPRLPRRLRPRPTRTARPASGALANPVCEGLYGQPGAHTAPYYAYRHSARVVAGERARRARPRSRLAFYDGGTFPREYDDALFFSDYARRCIWAIRSRAPTGCPTRRGSGVHHRVAGPVDMQVGPGGALFFVDIAGALVDSGTRGQPATDHRATATPDRGPAPLTVVPRARLDRSRGRAAHFRLGPRRRRRLRRRQRRRRRSGSTRRPTPPSGCACATASGLEDFDAGPPCSPGIPPGAAIAAPAAGRSWAVGDGSRSPAARRARRAPRCRRAC